MTGEGVVISLHGSQAIVSVQKRSACGHDCKDCSACTLPVIEVRVSNPIGAQKGDRVIIEQNTKRVLSVALLVYVLPVFLLIVAAILCEAFTPGALYTVGIFAVMIALWVFVIKTLNKKITMQNAIVSIIKD